MQKAGPHFVVDARVDATKRVPPKARGEDMITEARPSQKQEFQEREWRCRPVVW